MNTIPFSPADILLPDTDRPEAWATIACDQFTSEPEYWDSVRRQTADALSCYHLTLPEIYLDKPDTAERIDRIRQTMEQYLNDRVFREYRDALIFVERTLADGRVRKGLVGKLDLAAYDYTPGSRPLIRPTEGTVLSRIPARVQIRKDAPIELPHVMVLIDDRERTVLEPLDPSDWEVLYDFDLMENGGHLKGYLLPDEAKKAVLAALEALQEKSNGLLFAVGDGNHSLASAKAHAATAAAPEAGYALAEITNIHDEALDFEPIYRVMFGIDPADVIVALRKAFPESDGRPVEYQTADTCGRFFVGGLETKVLQDFLDEYAAAHPGAQVDYIHGKDSLMTLARRPGAIGFLFGGITKETLFPYVAENGPLPRKTFSMGEARDKRYYMEARRIR